MFICAADGIIVVEHTGKASLQVQSLRKQELVAELTKRVVHATGSANKLKARLKAEIEKTKEKYSSEQRNTDVFHLDRNIRSFESACPVSDEILLVSSDVGRIIYQVLIQKDGVGLIGVVTQLLAFPENVTKITSVTSSNGNLYFSSDGHKGDLQASLHSRVVTCLVKASGHCEVHGIAVFKQGIAFSDPKSRQVKQYTTSAGVSILAGTGKEGTGKGSAKFASFMQPSGLLFRVRPQLDSLRSPTWRSFNHHRFARNMQIPFIYWKDVPIFWYPQETQFFGAFVP